MMAKLVAYEMKQRSLFNTGYINPGGECKLLRNRVVTKRFFNVKKKKRWKIRDC